MRRFILFVVLPNAIVVVILATIVWLMSPPQRPHPSDTAPTVILPINPHERLGSDGVRVRWDPEECFYVRADNGRLYVSRDEPGRGAQWARCMRTRDEHRPTLGPVLPR